MAEFVEYNLLYNKHLNMLPADYGYIIVPLFGDRRLLGILPEEQVWIEENIKGKWSSWNFGMPGSGQSFAFKLEEDAMAFKLRWFE